MSTHELELPQSLDHVSLPDQLPPIVLVAFTRPELLQQVLLAIRQQTLLPRQIIAFVDGARSSKDEPLIHECIELLKDFSRQIPVEVIARPKNLGCDRNVVLALTEVCSRYDSLIYLEDDVVPNPGFYDRMCRLLTAYRPYPQVGSVSAFANFPHELEPLIDRDFMVSNRIFALGFGIWRDRWQKLNLAGQSQGANPFKNFYNIPATIQTKHTLLNQFFLEKNKQTDWVITLTLNALAHDLIHITPKVSFVRNIGFGHPEAKTYRGAEPDWINFRFDPTAHPDSLPSSLDLMPVLAKPLEGIELAAHLEKASGVWLSLPAIGHFWRKYPGFENFSAFLKLFLARLPMMIRRWRKGLLV
ncbi:MAG: glycosyltransferase [Leptolyngbyaceae cyanobacterium CSU_1_3]|nr:glycosyltransferase [Leptolyngbyaceae cyanobacterium CSU_1_3]